MKNNLYLELTDRTKQIFKTVVESYLETGSPSGSETVLKRAGLDISSASVRNILSNLQKEGLLFSPHTSAGRIPTDKGMRFFVDGLLEFGRISKSEKENIEQLSSSKTKSYQEVLDEARPFCMKINICFKCNISKLVKISIFSHLIYLIIEFYY